MVTVMIMLLASTPVPVAPVQPAFEVDVRVAGEAMHLQTVDPRLSFPDLLTGRSPDRLTDNPLVHGAAWTTLGLTIRSEWASLTTTLLGEHRGASSGPYPKDNLEVLPSFDLVAERPIVDGGDVHVGVRTGKIDDYRPYNGLLIGNLELDIFAAHLRWGRARVIISNIADLSVGINLDVDDGRDYILAVDDVGLAEAWGLDLRAGRFDYGGGAGAGPDPGEPARTGTQLAATLRAAGDFRLAGEFSRRDRGGGEAISGARNAWLLRADWSLRGDGGQLCLLAEHRAYDAAFNAGFFGWRGPIYRGDQVYPLRNYHHPFAQWPVYTTYQGLDVSTQILRAEARVRMLETFDAVGSLDLNRIEAGEAEAFTYPFYEAGIAWEASVGLELALTATNRAMNLDAGYQTLYLLKQPVMMLAARWEYAW